MCPSLFCQRSSMEPMKVYCAGKYVEPFLQNFSIPAIYIDLFTALARSLFADYVKEIITSV